MKKLLFLLGLIIILIFSVSLSTSASNVIRSFILEHDNAFIDLPEFTSFGFGVSALSNGPAGATNTGMQYSSTDHPAYAMWKPTDLEPGLWRISFWKYFNETYCNNADNTPVTVEIYHKGIKTFTTYLQNSPTQWIDFGEVEFAGDGTEYIKIYRESGTNGNNRIFVDSIKFELIRRDHFTYKKDGQTTNFVEPGKHVTVNANIAEFATVPNLSLISVIYKNGKIFDVKISGKDGDKTSLHHTAVMPLDGNIMLKSFLWGGSYYNKPICGASTVIQKPKLHISQYGGLPDGSDTRPALIAALRKADEYGGTDILFDEGEYYFSSPANWTTNSYHITLNNVQNVNILGNNTTLIFGDNFSGGFLFNACENIAVDGFNIKYSKRPFSQMIVDTIDTTTHTFNVTILDGYDDIFSDLRYPEVLARGVSFGTIRDRENPIHIRKTAANFFRIDSVIPMGNKKYTITMQESHRHILGNENHIMVGEKLVYSNRGITGTTFRVDRSSGITISNINMNESPGTVVTCTYSTGILHFDNIRLLRSPGSWMTANADGYHLQGNSAKIIIENSEMEGLLDDFINFYQVPHKILAINSSDELSVFNTAATLAVDDVLVIYDTSTGTELARPVITQVTNVSGGKKLKLDREVLGMNADKVYVYVASKLNASGSIIRNNIYRDSRGHGILLRANDVRIENNFFQNIMASAIHVQNTMMGDPYDEGYAATNISILNNKFYNCDYVNPFKTNMGTIHIITNAENGNPVHNLHKNITIEGNEILPAAKFGIFLSGVDNALIKNNTINSTFDTPLATTRAGIYLKGVNGGSIMGNSITDHNSGTIYGIQVTSTSSTDLVVAENEFSLKAGATEVRDDRSFEN